MRIIFLVTTADSAEDAYDKTQYVKFDLIILDIMMPGKNGLEFIQEYGKALNTPIILLTARNEAEDRVKGLEIGADDYLPKPFEPKELVLRIKNILNKINKLDILVNNAGNNRPEHFTKIKKENMEYLVELNMKAAFNVAQLCSKKNGSIKE